MARYWIELVLPLYSLVAVVLYFRPAAALATVPTSVGESLAIWLAWALIGALTGVLALSALFLTFYLLYSPFYLITQLAAVTGSRRWVDRREFRFYVSCFAVLCVLASLVFVNPVIAGSAFVVLSGSAHLLWRMLV
jgi:hypothetical protein